ncbi:MAG: protein kinase [Pyrinomonadaceae bacterium]
MNTETWQKIDALFDEYLDSPTLKRATFLDERCDDSEIREQLEKLIRAIDADDDSLDDRSFASIKEIVEPETDDLIGKKLLSYEIRSLIGHGGMGSVYLAERSDDFEKVVAIKVISKYGVSQEDIDNIRRERQILARLEHPNIARILDGGTADGIPFIVMEYVDGVPLNEYCRGRSVGEKLRMFRDVCKAVSYAHANLIVHSDLKPRNILVAADGTVKLLDFGIANLLHGESEAGSVATGTSDRALTPDYASPEQFLGEPITVATDVYALGILLYEILADRRPYSVAGMSVEESVTAIRKASFSPPSNIKDIDATVAKALAFEATKRYRTVQELDADIANYLEDRPVSSRPNTFLYRLEKVFRRNKLVTAVAGLLLVLLVSWLATSIWQRNYARGLADENRRAAYSAEMILAGNEYEKTNLNRVNELVQKYIPSPGEEDLRGFEWYYLKSLLEPSSKIATFIHNDEVWNADFSPDGRLLTTVSNDNIVRTWDVASRSIVSQTEKFQGAWKAAYFPDSKRVAVTASSASNPVVKVFDAGTSSELLTISGHTKRVRAVDVSPNGKLIATGSQDRTVRVWDAETGTELHKFELGTSDRGREIADVQFSSDGGKLIVAGFELLGVIDTKNWQIREMDIKELTEKGVNLFSWKLAIAPSQQTIALGNWNGEVILIDANTLKLERIFRNHQSNVKSLAFSPDGKTLATSSWDRTVKFIDLTSFEVVNELKGHFAGIHELAYSPTGNVLMTAGGDFSVNLWDAAAVGRSNAIFLNSPNVFYADHAANIIGWSGAVGVLENTSLPDAVKAWSINTAIKVLSGDIASNVAVMAVADQSGTIYLFNMDSGGQTQSLKLRDKAIYALQLLPDASAVIVAYDDGIVQQISIANGNAVFEIKAHSGLFRGMSVSADGKYFATGGNDNLVNVFETGSGRLVHSLIGNMKPLYAVAFSDDGKKLAGVGATIRHVFGMLAAENCSMNLQE